MIDFPKHLYTDVRIEEVVDTRIRFKRKELREQKVRRNKGAFIRVFDGRRWYYGAVTDLDKLQRHVDGVAAMAEPDSNIDNHPVVKALEANKSEDVRFAKDSVTKTPLEKKRALLEEVLDCTDDETIVNTDGFYVDNRTVKTFFSSKGASVTFDKETAGIGVVLDIVHGENKDRMASSMAKTRFEDLHDAAKDFFAEEFAKDVDFVKRAVPAEAGEHPVLLSPLATGVFTHESFGHKSEADFMIGDETMKREWSIGKEIGPEYLSIVDDGNIEGSGTTPYDDEGTAAKKTHLIKDGKLAGRLHSALTSASLQEKPTGNARAVDFTFEPIVRMTTTYIEKGETPLQEIISGIEKGYFVDTIKHGSGMSTFTIAPARAYRIEKGEIKEPVKISVVTGSVFETLGHVEKLSSEFELLSFVGGGCGKMEQFPLPVGFGGPYTLVKKLKVQ